MLAGDVVDELHDDDGLADACSAEQARLAAAQIRLQQVNHLDAGFKHLQVDVLLFKSGSVAMDRILHLRFNRSHVVHRLADHVHHAAQRLVAHRHEDRLARIHRLHAAHHPVGGLHGDAPEAAFAQVLLDLQDDVNRGRHVKALADHVNRVVNLRQILFAELNVHGRTCYLDHFSDVVATAGLHFR